ncbi:hypothetical protein XI00_26445 [Bradyrhizobium sp. CCBAU 21359]|nr:hypothetical protein [Bradyrhizobium sp. CCBAU 21360]MDA9457711.1 hypothetical protein [Bradyrhizobium sp. CCBAU 21359]
MPERWRGTRESLRRCIVIKVRYEAKKTGRSASAVKKAVKKVGNSRKRVEKRLGARPPQIPPENHARAVSLCMAGSTTCM